MTTDMKHWNNLRDAVKRAFLDEVKPTDLVRSDLHDGAAGCVATRAATAIEQEHGAMLRPAALTAEDIEGLRYAKGQCALILVRADTHESHKPMCERAISAINRILAEHGEKP